MRAWVVVGTATESKTFIAWDNVCMVKAHHMDDPKSRWVDITFVGGAIERLVEPEAGAFLEALVKIAKQT